MRLWLISFWSLNRLKWRMSLSYTSNIKNILSFHEPEAWKRYPCQAEPLCLGHNSTHPSSRPGNSTWYTNIFMVLIVPNVSCTWSGTVIILLQFSHFVKRKGFGILFLSWVNWGFAVSENLASNAILQFWGRKGSLRVFCGTPNGSEV